MKIIYLITFSLVLIACGGSKEEKPKKKKKKLSHVDVEVAIKESYALIAEQSQVRWNRELDQKPTKQNVKFLGGNLKMDLGNVTMTSSGEAKLKEGVLETIDGSIDRVEVVFDMATFQLAKEKGNGILDVKNYPEGELLIQQISQDSAGYHGKGLLTLQDSTNTVDVSFVEKEGEVVKTLEGKFVFQTLDYPLREQVTKKDVNKDEITVNFVFSFTDGN